MFESFPRSTVAVLAGVSDAAGVAGAALDMAMAVPVAAAAAMTITAASAQVFRLKE